jgi:hypothetical protein
MMKDYIPVAASGLPAHSLGSMPSWFDLRACSKGRPSSPSSRYSDTEGGGSGTDATTADRTARRRSSGIVFSRLLELAAPYERTSLIEYLSAVPYLGSTAAMPASTTSPPSPAP